LFVVPVALLAQSTTPGRAVGCLAVLAFLLLLVFCSVAVHQCNAPYNAGCCAPTPRFAV